MGSVICSVKDIGTADRQALEHVIGQRLSDHQQLVIRVLSEDVLTTPDVATSKGVTLPDWCNVYEGLSDEEISALEEVVLTRANLTRDVE